MYIREIKFRCLNNNKKLVLSRIKELAMIPCVHGYIVSKRRTDHPYDYAEADFDFSLTLFFQSNSDLDTYIEHETHRKFVDEILDKIETKVYDLVQDDSNTQFI